jgi:cytochrome b6-f complex iron-sulfur subunit
MLHRAAPGCTAGWPQSSPPTPAPTGTWHTVATTADLTDCAVRAFDLGSVNGFVERTSGRLRAVSGACTHLGCRLMLDWPARELTCPYHNAAFALTGKLVRHQLKTPPPALPGYR